MEELGFFSTLMILWFYELWLPAGCVCVSKDFLFCGEEKVSFHPQTRESKAKMKIGKNGDRGSVEVVHGAWVQFVILATVVGSRW